MYDYTATAVTSGFYDMVYQMVDKNPTRVSI